METHDSYGDGVVEAVDGQNTFILVGQVWRSHQKQHPNWEVEVRKIGSSHVQADVLRPPQVRGRKVNYGMSQFIRDFDFVRGGDKATKLDVLAEGEEQIEMYQAERGTTDTKTVDDTRLCTTCFVVKPLNAFSFAPSTHGGYTDKRLKTCKECVVAKRATGARAYYERLRVEKAEAKAVSWAEAEPVVVGAGVGTKVESDEAQGGDRAREFNRLAESWFVPSTAAQHVTCPRVEPPVYGDARQLASELVELAARIEALQEPVGYRELMAAVDTVLTDGSMAAGVFVVPMPAIRALRAALDKNK